MKETKGHILVVEDEEKIRQGLVDFLEFKGFKVSTASDGLEAERQVKDKRFDLILLDLMLPKISGEQLCRQWRQDGLQTPILMVTAKGQEKEVVLGKGVDIVFQANPPGRQRKLVLCKAIVQGHDHGAQAKDQEPHQPRGDESVPPALLGKRHVTALFLGFLDTDRRVGNGHIVTLLAYQWKLTRLSWCRTHGTDTPCGATR